MTNNEEYEKLKQDAWEKYARAFGIQGSEPNEAFSHVFDYAFNLGIKFKQPVLYVKEPKGGLPKMGFAPILFDPDREKRLEIATDAMQGLLNATSVERFTLRIKPEAIAQAAVEYADALINELNKKKDEHNN